MRRAHGAQNLKTNIKNKFSTSRKIFEKYVNTTYLEHQNNKKSENYA